MLVFLFTSTTGIALALLRSLRVMWYNCLIWFDYHAWWVFRKNRDHLNDTMCGFFWNTNKLVFVLSGSHPTRRTKHMHRDNSMQLIHLWQFPLLYFVSQIINMHFNQVCWFMPDLKYQNNCIDRSNQVFSFNPGDLLWNQWNLELSTQRLKLLLL